MRGKFTPPTAENLTEYAATIGYADFDGQAFLDYYEACGWVVGQARKPMVSWQAAVRTWRRMAAQWSGKPVRKDSPEILAYAQIAREKIAGGGYEIGRFWRKVRDTIGVEGLERVQELAKQK